jgi:hypothetical protein
MKPGKCKKAGSENTAAHADVTVQQTKVFSALAKKKKGT